MEFLRLMVLVYSVIIVSVCRSTNTLPDDNGRDERNITASCEILSFYRGSEKQNVEICFDLEEALNPNFITILDNGTAERGVDFLIQENLISTQTDVVFCFFATILEDSAKERTEVVSFTIESEECPLSVERTCQLAIQDATDPNIECLLDNNLMPGQPIRLRDIDDSDRFCLRDTAINNRGDPVPLKDYFPADDCTKWDHSTYNDINTQFFQESVLYDLSSVCSENVYLALDVLLSSGALNQDPSSSNNCSTNCALGVIGESGSSSVLLMEGVDILQANGFIRDFSELNSELCTMQLECCFESVPNSCFVGIFPSDPAPEGPNGNGVKDGLPAAVIAGAAVGGFLVLVIIVAIVVIVIAVLVFVYFFKQRKYKFDPESAGGNTRAVVYKAKQLSTDESLHLENNGMIPAAPDLPLTNPTYDGPPDYQEVMNEGDSYHNWKRVFSGLIIKSSNLRYGEQLGEGAFGKVLKGTLILTTSTQRRAGGSIKRVVAIKTLKTSDPEEIEDFITESAIMLDFRHPNVLRLVGVCFDTDDKLPAIVLPFMANGDLRNYLKSKRPSQNSKSVDTYPEGLSEEVFLGMCLEIARGMKYLATCKFVHRDLAARNCMVDENLGVKVADFGLSREVYHSNYYRLTHRQRLPVKWMAPESLFDNVFTEKTDVWSFGVVCWEIFKFGRKPFTGIDNPDIPDHISEDHRLKKPLLCPEKLYDIMKQTWSEEPEMRPDFSTIVDSLSQLKGEEEEEENRYEYFVAEGPEEEDIGGDNIYSELESPLYKNWEKDSSSSLEPAMYEVPVPSRQGSVVVLDAQEELAAPVPCEYEVPVSSSEPSQANIDPTETGNQPKNKHIYQTLEPGDTIDK